MRVIEAFDKPVQAVTVSPDGRFLAAAAGFELAAIDWLTGERVARAACPAPIRQLAFTADGNWVVFAHDGGVFRLETGRAKPIPLSGPGFSGGVAVSPDGRLLVATVTGWHREVRLDQWELPGWRPKPGVEFRSAFNRLAFSPDGEHIAGVSPQWFELRFANSFGLNRREEPPVKLSRWQRHLLRRELLKGRAVELPPEEPPRFGFVTFAPDSGTVVFGWDAEFRVMETRAGNVRTRVPSPGESFRDAAFVGSGRQLVTVDGTAVMRLWSAESWELVRGYDWAAGGLTCVVATADGLAGVCGTDTGRLVVFDVDE